MVYLTVNTPPQLLSSFFSTWQFLQHDALSQHKYRRTKPSAYESQTLKCELQINLLISSCFSQMFHLKTNQLLCTDFNNGYSNCMKR